ncbi:MAG: toxin secretion protein, partial [Planctomycetota bacterium]
MIASVEAPPVRGKTVPRGLAPIAYDDAAMPSLRLARSSRIARRVGQLLAVLLVVGIVLVVTAPWQQSVSGSGSVIAFAPEERQQILEAPIKGRVAELGEGIVENAFVVKDQLIARISDIDEMYLDRIKRQLV